MVFDYFFYYIFAAIIGLAVGSFLNMLTMRLGEDEPVMTKRSHCPKCKHQLSAFDLVPVVSFLLLRGKCRYCGVPISWQYPLVEIATAICFVIVVFAHQPLEFYGLLVASSFMIRDLVFTTGLIALFVLDLRWYIVPDVISLPLVAVALIFNLIFGVPLTSLILGMAVGGGFYFILWAISRGRWVGAGDIRLGLVLGAMLGWPLTLGALYVAYICGGIIATWLLITKRKHLADKLPMGVFLTAATWLVMMV